MKKSILHGIHILFLMLFLFLILNGKMMLWLALYAASLLLALLFGRVYCGYACPMNTLMIPTEWFSKKMNWQTDKIPKVLSSGKFAWFALIGSLVIMVFGKKVLRINLPILLIWLSISIIVTLRYKPAVFHNFICPFGILQKIFGKRPIFSERVDKQLCIGCKRCEKVCPTDAIEVYPVDKKAQINTALCLQCTNCQVVCPKDAISYSKQLDGVNT